MPSDISQQQVGALQDLVQRVVAENDSPSDTWAGKRQTRRRSLVIPVTTRLVDEEGQVGPPHTQWLRDISASGIGLTSHYPFEEGQLLEVEIATNGSVWSGRMRIMHRTETVGSYKLGLQLVEPAAEAPTPAPAQPNTFVGGRLIDPTRNLRKACRERTWLAEAKEEIRKATRAYSLARRSWGLLGVSVKRQVEQAMSSIAGPIIAETEDDRRVAARHSASCDASVVVHSVARWRLFPARVLDVSKTGVRLVVPMDLDNDPVESQLAGSLEFRGGMALLVGVGSAPQTLWVPGEVMRCRVAEDSTCELGIAFNTAAALKAFGC